MSRIGKLPIEIPSGVTISVDNDTIVVNGAKGSLIQPSIEGVKVEVSGGNAVVTRVDDSPGNRAKHGLMRTLISNMVVGVTSGFSKQLEVNGVGFKVAQVGTDLKFNVGYSHDVIYKVPQEISVVVDQNVITVSGIDKQLVGQAAAKIRDIRKPEPYKGKGIKYVGERIIRKSGKSGKEK